MYYNKYDTTKSLGVYHWCIKIPQCGYMEHWLNFITFYVQKHITALAMCYNPTLVHDKLLGAPAFVKLIYWMAHQHLIYYWLSFNLVLSENNPLPEHDEPLLFAMISSAWQKTSYKRLHCVLMLHDVDYMNPYANPIDVIHGHRAAAVTCYPQLNYQGFTSPQRTSYQKGLTSPEPGGLNVKMFILLWNLAGGLAAVLPNHLPNVKAIVKL